MMTIADLMRICLEFDQQQLTSRPSPWGVVAERLAVVCEHAEPSLRDNAKILGDWQAVDLSPVRKGAKGELDQPTVGLLDRAEAAERRLAEVTAERDKARKGWAKCMEQSKKPADYSFDREEHPTRVWIGRREFGALLIDGRAVIRRIEKIPVDINAAIRQAATIKVIGLDGGAGATQGETTS